MPNNFWKTGVFVGLISIAPLTAHAAPSAKTQAPQNAAPSPNDFPDIPRNHWAYVAMEKLGRARLTFRHQEDLHVASPRVMTRYEAAVVTARALDKLAEIAPTDRLHFADMSWTQIQYEISARLWLSQFDDSLAALCTEFADEIRLLAVRDPMPRRGAAEQPKTEKYPAFPNTPKNNWAYRAVVKMERARLIPAFREIRRGESSLLRTRYEFAVATTRAMDTLRDVSPAHALRLDRMSWTQIEREFFVRWWLSQFSADIAALKVEFAPELKRLSARNGEIESRPQPPQKTPRPTRPPSMVRPHPGAIDIGSK